MEDINMILLAVTLIISLASLVFCLMIMSKIKSFGKEDSFQEAENGKLRQDISRELINTRTELNTRMDSVQKTLSSSISEGLQSGNAIQTSSLTKLSQEMQHALTSFSDRVSAMVQGIDARMTELRKTQDEKLESIRTMTETKITQMQEGNQQKLDEMQKLVDEKLQKTLNERVTESFKIVGERLEQVYKGLGEMQSLATGVGDLKKILSNVKTRGIFGEIQLSRILEQILTNDQYCENIATKKGSREVVEYAIKLPAKNDYDDAVLLPIDSKFPLDIYAALVDAYEIGDSKTIEQAGKALEACIKKNAKDIRDKYIDPPNTTDFAIMFLPTESLYAEVTKRTELIEELTRVYHVSVSGPSTISALLNSLQMGFRTLAIEKRSHEVWNLLSAVKTEFESFESVLANVKKRLESADDELTKLVGVRTRAVLRKLKNVQALPKEEAAVILNDDGEYEGYEKELEA